MAAPYLNEIRPARGVRHRLRDIAKDVANEFGVRGVFKPRYVPHITLFGPYNTDKGHEAKQIVKDTLASYDVVPYRIDGFGRFEYKNVIYADVVPSPELRELRRDLSRRLRPISYNYQSYDSDYFYDFHITMANKGVGDRFEDIWEYVNTHYDPEFDEYATRVTSLRGREMMWEYDLLQERELRSRQAKSTQLEERTGELLGDRTSPSDHENLAPKPSAPIRVAKLLGAKIRRRW